MFPALLLATSFLYTRSSCQAYAYFIAFYTSPLGLLAPWPFDSDCFRTGKRQFIIIFMEKPNLVGKGAFHAGFNISQYRDAIGPSRQTK